MKNEKNHVYCTNCIHCRLDDMAHTNCGFENVCNCWDPEDSRSISDRPMYKATPELAEENIQRKHRRGANRAKQRAREHRRYIRVINSGGYKPSIWADYDFEREEYPRYGRVQRAKHSHRQKFLKNYSNRRIRRMSVDKPIGKGNAYRKQFDYWWEWI